MADIWGSLLPPTAGHTGYPGIDRAVVFTALLLTRKYVLWRYALVCERLRCEPSNRRYTGIFTLPHNPGPDRHSQPCFEKNFRTKLPRTTLGTGLARTGTNTGTPRKIPPSAVRWSMRGSFTALLLRKNIRKEVRARNRTETVSHSQIG